MQKQQPTLFLKWLIIAINDNYAKTVPHIVVLIQRHDTTHIFTLFAAFHHGLSYAFNEHAKISGVISTDRKLLTSLHLCNEWSFFPRGRDHDRFTAVLDCSSLGDIFVKHFCFRTAHNLNWFYDACLRIVCHSLHRSLSHKTSLIMFNRPKFPRVVNQNQASGRLRNCFINIGVVKVLCGMRK